MKYAIVTGSTKGIGRAIAERLLFEGWFVFINYANDDSAALKFEKENEKYSDNFQIIKMELSDYKGVKQFIDKILQTITNVDAVILNAGATDRSKFDDITPKGWEYVVNTNINAPFYMVHSLRNHINENGSILFIGSVCGIYPHAGSPAYGVTKAATHQMAKELVKFFEQKNITVNAVAPGFADTPRQKAKPMAQKKRIEDKTAVHRFALPDEIASLCWEVMNNRFINGAVLSIDGGYCYK